MRVPHEFTGKEEVAYGRAGFFFRLIIDETSSFEVISPKKAKHSISFEQIKSLNVEGCNDYTTLIDGTVAIVDYCGVRTAIKLSEIQRMKEDEAADDYRHVIDYGINDGKLMFYFDSEP